MQPKDDLGIYLQKKLLRNNSFTIISNDCWGAEVYRNFDLAYRTPFVGLFVMAPCFIKMLQNLKFYMNADFIFVKESKYEERNEDRREKNVFYPIGVLNNEIEIHFLHYESEEEARGTWNKRKERINWQNLFIKFDGSKDACTYELLKEYDSLPFANKLCLSNQDFPEIKCCEFFRNWDVDGAKMYRISLEKVNMVSWLNGKSWKSFPLYSFFYRIFIKNNNRFLNFGFIFLYAVLRVK